MDDFRLVPLTQGKHAIVDSSDFDLVSGLTWQYSTHGYAVHSYHDRQTKKRKSISMHRLILGVSDRSIHIDHISGNGLDNRRSNLRTCTHTENHFNRHRPYGKSRFLGVSFSDKEDRWTASLKAYLRQYWLGYYETEEDAARAYDSAAKYYQGRFASLNFPTDDSILPLSKEDICKERHHSYKIRTGRKSKYRGVYQIAGSRGWMAKCSPEKYSLTHLGTWPTEELAAIAFDSAVKHYNIKTILNFPGRNTNPHSAMELVSLAKDARIANAAIPAAA